MEMPTESSAKKTRTAVRNFQMNQGLSQDGKVGKNTLSALENGSHLDGGVGGCGGIPFSYATLNTTYSAAVVTGGGSLIVRDAPNGTNVGTVSNGSTHSILILPTQSSTISYRLCPYTKKYILQNAKLMV